MMSGRIRVLLAVTAAALAVPRVARAGRVHTALTEFDACRPLADGRVIAGSGGGVVIVDGDGREVRRVTALDGLPGTKVHALEETPEGIWVGTDKGIARIILEGETATVTDAVETKAVRDILVENDSILVATWGQGVMRIKEGKGAVVFAGSAPREQRVTALTRYAGQLWWTTAGAGLWHAADRGPATKDARIPGGAMLWDLLVHDGELWVSGEQGAERLGAAHRESRSVRSMAVIHGQLHVASFGEGLRRIGAPSTPDVPGERFARSVGVGHGSACLGTQSDLWIRRDARWETARFNTSLPANDIAAFAVDGETSYVGTFDHGVARLHENRVEQIDLEGDPHVNALAIDRADGALWIGTSTGLTRFKGGRLTRFARASGLPSNHVMSLYPLRGGGVLVGTAVGPARVRDGMVSAVGGKGRLITGNVWSVAESSDGAEWLGTTRGVFRVRGSRVDHYQVASGELEDDWVMALAVADDGVFVGTYKAGVVRLITTGAEIVVRRLGKGWINPGGLHWDGTHLRAATMHGAFRGDGVNAEWTSELRGPGLDTTAYVPADDDSEWVVTRRGLEKRAYASVSK